MDPYDERRLEPLDHLISNTVIALIKHLFSETQLPARPPPVAIILPKRKVEHRAPPSLMPKRKSSYQQEVGYKNTFIRLAKMLMDFPKDGNIITADIDKFIKDFELLCIQHMVLNVYKENQPIVDVVHVTGETPISALFEHIRKLAFMFLFNGDEKSLNSQYIGKKKVSDFCLLAPTVAMEVVEHLKPFLRTSREFLQRAQLSDSPLMTENDSASKLPLPLNGNEPVSGTQTLPTLSSDSLGSAMPMNQVSGNCNMTFVDNSSAETKDVRLYAGERPVNDSQNFCRGKKRTNPSPTVDSIVDDHVSTIYKTYLAKHHEQKQ